MPLPSNPEPHWVERLPLLLDRTLLHVERKPHPSNLEPLRSDPPPHRPDPLPLPSNPMPLPLLMEPLPVNPLPLPSNLGRHRLDPERKSVE
jgi:hypothetical protein